MEYEIPVPAAAQQIPRLIEQMETVIRGKRHQIEMVITCLLAKGHILMEDNPGTGKTILARTLSHSVSSQTGEGGVLFKRIQFTPDLLPMDLIGSYIFNEQTKDFIFKKGPLFCNILLADEINRASPKVQSALLECMAEGQITIAEKTMRLEHLFFTIATQNPVEMEGTYPLPAAQLDRFFMKISFGYVDEATEIDIYKNYQQIQYHLDDLQAVLSLNDILALQQEAGNVFVHDEIIQSVSNIVRGTRTHADISLGASVRAGIALMRCLRAFALVKGRSFVIEDDIHALSKSVLDHRLVYRNRDARLKAFDGILNKELERLSRLKLYR